MELYHFYSGSLPLILSIPHAGTYVPEPLLTRFTPEAKQLPDTDWHVEKLYAFAKDLDINLLVATHSRYVIDLNRSPGNESLYPGRFTTGLCPTTLFDGRPIYLTGKEPDEQEIQARIKAYWQPYHQKLQSLINELSIGKRVIVFDAHSICSQIPQLFEGKLPDLNLGTADGQAAPEELAIKLIRYCKKSTYSYVLNGRFKGGYITRHYGNPLKNVYAVQLELAQSIYMQESFPYTYDLFRARQLQALLVGVLTRLIEFLVS